MSEENHGLRILIVEDDDGQQFSLRSILEHEGFSTEGCATAEEALGAFRQADFAVAIVDLHLPDGSGTQVLEQTRALDDRVQVIIYTGYGSFASAKDSVNYGAFAYLEKPCDPADLVCAVHRAAQSWMKQALRQSQARYQKLAELSPVGIFHTDAKGRFLFVNQRWCRIAGLDAKEATGDAWTAALHPADRDEVHEGWREAVDAERAFNAEFRFRHPGGQTRWVYAQTLPETNGDGAVTGHVGTVTDITQRKLAEESLRLLDSALQQTHLPVAITTSGMEKPPEIVYLNQAFTEMTGYRPWEALGRPAHLLYGPKTDLAALEVRRGLLREGRAYEGRLVYYAKDGSEMTLLARSDPVRDDQDRIAHWVTVYEPLKEFQRELSHRATDLRELLMKRGPARRG